MMKSSTHPRTKIRSRLINLLSVPAIGRLARESGFTMRAARKINAVDFVLSFFICCAGRRATLQNWASQLCILNGFGKKTVLPSKQAICKRLTESSSTFAEALLTALIGSRIHRITGKGKGIFNFFSSVLVQDSTTLALPDSLSSFFKGNFSRGITKAVARIQCILDLKTMLFAHFSLGSFCSNDQSAASQVCHLVRKGTLVLRDLGYFVISSFKQIEASGGYYLSRLKYGVSLFNTDGRNLELCALLKSASARGAISLNVLVGNTHRMAARLIIVPLPSDLANARRRRARADRDRRLNHNKEYMLCLGYHLLLTNVGPEIWTPQEADQAYRLRWSIECMFKGFKSAGLHMEQLCQLVKSNAERVRTVLFFALCFITVHLTIIYQLRFHLMKRRKQDCTYLSLNKALSWICDNFSLWLNATTDLKNQLLLQFCCYDKRKDRINLIQKLQYTHHLS